MEGAGGYWNPPWYCSFASATERRRFLMSEVPVYMHPSSRRSPLCRGCRGLLEPAVVLLIGACATSHYRGTSLVRKRTPLGPYRRPMGVGG